MLTEGVLFEREAVYEYILKEKQRIAKVNTIYTNIQNHHQHSTDVDRCTVVNHRK